MTVYIVDGARSPFLKVRGEPGPFSASDLAVQVGKALLLRQPFPIREIGEVILGCAMPRENEANIARVAALRMGCSENTPAWTVQRNCGSGLQAIDCALKDIQQGRYDIVLAGGTEVMSRSPFILSNELVQWLVKIRRKSTVLEWLKTFFEVRPRHLMPQMALIQGLTDSQIGLNMGQTAELLAERFHIQREEMDLFALNSHQKLARALDEHLLTEIVPIYDTAGHCYEWDTGLRRDTSLEKLAKLEPYFDRPFGLVTAGNSSQITDGAALLVLASENAVKKHNLPVMGKIIDVEWAALAPKMMGLGPVKATEPLLKRHHLNLNDIDYWEINEAFAAQVLACLKSFEQDQLGTLDMQRLNVDGGAIALGHPVGASGARIVLHLLHVLNRYNKKRGIAAMCIGGGQGGAILLERV
jgi:acetyl-CoA C-acetyltransferase